MPVQKRARHPNNDDPTYRGRGKAAKTPEDAAGSGSAGSAGSAAPSDAAAAKHEQRAKAFSNVGDEYICPITHELPIKPVLAEDGKVYEEADILKHFASTTHSRVKSPMTNEFMGKTLKPAPDRVALFENLIPTGIWDCERAKEWLAKYNAIKADENYVKQIKMRAEAGDAQSMLQLGDAYANGKFRVAKDPVVGHEWYQKAADLSHPTACANMGLAHNHGSGGVPQNKSLAASYILAAAMLGSEAGCYMVGDLYYHGRLGYPEDEEKAKAWFTKMERCGLKDAGDVRRERAKMRLESIGVDDDDEEAV
jgi:TPR repeat protein